MREGAARPDRRETIPGDVEKLAHWLDSAIRLPGGWRIGIDGLIGLVPGFGDAAGTVLSLYVVARAAALGVPGPVLARMLLNVALDGVVGAVPILGDVFDFAFKANVRNAALLQRSAANAPRARRASAAWLAGVAAVLILVAALVVALGILLARWIAAAF